MRIKKTLLKNYSALTTLSLLTVSLSSCAKNVIDSKYRIDLNNDGFIFNGSKKNETIGDVNYSSAIKNALSRSDDWQSFKTALANELIYQWYIDRTDTNKNNRNEDFKFDLEKYKKEVDNTYNEKIQSCKSMYGTDYDFYFKNVYLAPNGGTASSYKHKLLVDKIANEFADKVFNNSYFSLKMDNSQNILYPNIYTKAEKNVDVNKIRNPEYWDKIGFYARSANNFFVDEEPKSYSDIDTDWLSKHPDGDYAMVQQYTFDKWFEIEKPFFSDAALFKYSLPKYVGNGKLSEIYNGSFAGVSISDDADSIKEEFPFFGADPEKNSTKKFKSFLDGLQNSNFNTPYFDDNKQRINSNGTFSIDLDNTDDSQSVLLCLGRQMFGNESSNQSSNALYTPYALAAGNLLQNLINCTETNEIANVLTAQHVYQNIEKYYDSADGIDNPAILANFWYTNNQGWNPLPTDDIKSYLDLDVCYGNYTTTDGETKHFHCPIFTNSKSNDFKWFYGDNTISGVQYITNAIQINDFPKVDGKTDQPWIMELNQSGMHVQTIDGYAYIKNYGSSKQQRLEALKNVVKYRLLQKEVDSAANSCISAQMYGENGFLKSYFKDNLADIVIGMSLSDSYNIFRSIDSYKLEKSDQIKEDSLFLYKIYSLDNEKMGNAYTELYEYLVMILSYDVIKKDYDALKDANKKIYDYRKTQIINSKEKIGESRTIGANGLLAPIVYNHNATKLSTIDYETANRIIILDIDQSNWLNLQSLLDNKINDIRNSKFVSSATNSSIKPNVAHAFSPQIKQAKNNGLNRFCFKSLIVDQLMYNSTGAVQATANEIKYNCYNWYQKYIGNNSTFLNNNSDDVNFVDKYVLEYNDAAKQAFTSLYKRNKLISGTEKKLSNYTRNSDLSVTDYWDVLNNAFDKNINDSTSHDGKYNDDSTNLQLFKATIMYLLSPNEATYNKPFDRFYEILNTRISEDDIAFVGYLTKGYANLNTQPIVDLTNDNDSQNNIYNFSANVDNIFDQTHMAGGDPVTKMQAAKLSSDKYWNVVNKKWIVDNEVVTKPLSGFLGIQSNWGNQLSGQLQTDVFNSFGNITTDSYDLSKKNKKYSELSNAKDASYYGCFHKFAGEKNNNGEYYNFSVTYNDTTISQDDFMNGNQQALKLAYKIANCSYFSDLKQWANNIANAYPGYSYFKEIVSDTSSYYVDINKLKIDMLRLLPCGNKASEHAHTIECFYRLKDVEVHTDQINSKYAYANNSNDTAFRLMLTQINKSDLIERKLTPFFDNNTKHWKFDKDCPLTEEEFWNVLFQFANETSVQDLCISNIVDNAFGSEKLIVHDARVYNEFNAAWIKNWVKKPIHEDYV